MDGSDLRAASLLSKSVNHLSLVNPLQLIHNQRNKVRHVTRSPPGPASRNRTSVATFGLLLSSRCRPGMLHM